MKAPNISPGDWISNPTGSPDYAKQYTVYPEDTGKDVALVYQGEHAEANARAFAAMPAVLRSLELAWKVAVGWKHDANPHGDLEPGDSMDYDAACINEKSHREALLQAGYTFE